MGEMLVPILWTDDLCSSQVHMHEFSGKFNTNITIKKNVHKHVEDSIRGVVVASGYMAARQRRLD